ncbi:hypothetical protein BIU97_09090 [Curtobacterium sp. MCBA15_009]|uniref:MoaD/ThiS family protein n=1 Tax=Curtobacterium sp. MCBA15_009 TaxID=1898737 RepID=UPI0008DE72B4|nr:MoaD/ThiS family protein [Curtobacterium sp. MCBA15_009]OII11009.1 hypothetical protein BIU97_09090 [Curtobacterium sp. MCBA15_009]
MTTIRFFAAARAAVGVDSVEAPAVSDSAMATAATATTAASATAASASTLGEALDAVEAADPERWAALQERCSYLVDGVTTRDRATSLQGVALVDVMPPFAGG